MPEDYIRKKHFSSSTKASCIYSLTSFYKFIIIPHVFFLNKFIIIHSYTFAIFDFFYYHKIVKFTLIYNTGVTEIVSMEECSDRDSRYKKKLVFPLKYMTSLIYLPNHFSFINKQTMKIKFTNNVIGLVIFTSKCMKLTK